MRRTFVGTRCPPPLAALALAMTMSAASVAGLSADQPAWRIDADAFMSGMAADEAAGDAADRYFGAQAIVAGRFGLRIDGDLRRDASLTLASTDLAALWRAWERGPVAIDLLSGARIDAAVPSATEALPEAGAVPLAGLRATLALDDATSLAFGASVAPDTQSQPAWRLSATLRLPLARGGSAYLDAAWRSPELSGPGADAAGAIGRGALRAGLRWPF